MRDVISVYVVPIGQAHNPGNPEYPAN
jgi:hypothetical protein